MGSLAWKILGSLATAAATLVAQRSMKAAWQAATGDAPPKNAKDPNVSGADVVVWAMLSAGAVAFAKYWATKKAAKYYEDSAGHPPKALTEAESEA